MSPYGFGGGEILFILVYLVIVIAAIAGWIVLLIAAWRGMRALEAIAKAMQERVLKDGS
jgi:uncharacterized membrane protein